MMDQCYREPSLQEGERRPEDTPPGWQGIAQLKPAGSCGGAPLRDHENLAGGQAPGQTVDGSGN